MTRDELTQLQTIATGRPFEVRPRLLKFLETVKVEEKVKTPRTEAQHRSLFLWFGQIEEICAQQGVTWNMLIKHTVDVAVTKEGLHNFWKVLQKALYRTSSTKELKKTGQIDRMVDHFALFLGKEGVEVPPFPSDQTRQEEELSGVRIGAHNNLGNQEYPDQDETNLADKF